MKYAVPMTLALILAACTSAPPPPATPDAPGATVPSAANDTCGAKPLAHLIGKPLSDPAVPPKSPKVRHIRPADAVTEDYRIERLNIRVDARDIIESLECG